MQKMKMNLNESRRRICLDTECLLLKRPLKIYLVICILFMGQEQPEGSGKRIVKFTIIKHNSNLVKTIIMAVGV